MNGNIFFNVWGRSEQPFQIFIGGRGIGKTYSTLQDVIEKKHIEVPFYLRRTSQEMTICATTGNPFKKINANLGTDVSVTYIEKNACGSIIQNGTSIGYTGALSNFSSVRGADFSDTTHIIYDEFIPEIHRKKIKGEGLAFLNLYETINRNRELFGEKPVTAILLSNSISLENDVLVQLDVVKDIQRMLITGQHRFTDRKRGIYVELCKSSVSELKKDTALYRLTKGTEFSEQALNNDFTNDLLHLVRKVKISEFFPYIQVSDICVYKHKSKDEYHIATKTEKTKYKYGIENANLVRLHFGNIYNYCVISNSISFDNYNTKMRFEKIIGISPI